LKVLNSSLGLVLFAAGCACQHPMEGASPAAKPPVGTEVASQRMGLGSPVLGQKLPPQPAEQPTKYQTDGPAEGRPDPNMGDSAGTWQTAMTPPKGVAQGGGGSKELADIPDRMSPVMKIKRIDMPVSGSWFDHDMPNQGGPASKSAQTASMLGTS